MDLHLELDEEEIEYLEEMGIPDILTANLTEALKSVVLAKPPDAMLSLVETMGSLGEKNQTLVQGYPVSCVDTVSLSLGPVIGEVTNTMAIILLEVKDPENNKVEITCDLYEKGTNVKAQSLTVLMPFQSPKAFVFNDDSYSTLEPDTEYVAVFSGLRKEDAGRTFALFKTKPNPEDIKTFKILALSCDRPDRMLLGQKNPWYELARKTYSSDVVLHLGDQVYNTGEDNDNTQQIFGKEFDSMDDKMKSKMKKRARALLRKKYRETWNKKMTRSSLQQGSHLMIWSDNDVANDFTTLKDQEGGQAYPPAFLQCGIEVYRHYQRILWDTEFTKGKVMPADDEYFNEFHCHTYGPIGIFLIDMRGNRITGDGVQKSDNPIVSDAQWEAIEAFFQNEDLKVIILASEIPFVGDDPVSIRDKAAKFDFLTDHWPYNLEDLTRLLDLSFDWKSQDEDGREVLLLGGDIHCGVSSVIRDKNTDLTINHLTTSPVTNHVCKFFPDLHGNINERYSYDHIVLGANQRNYAEISITIKPEFSVTAQLKAISTNMYKITDWMSDEEEG
eukprot:TRINITY_DN35023_c0_g1_i1.p1 TRINITY_DN35023_c0_g1~~TRINITY_DN35023_c0_g1_i1.p1  ORF type:complete len:558 (-),score=155.12 TRINITY_DN35023_c0_g1_i1:176-1849(-)